MKFFTLHPRQPLKIRDKAVLCDIALLNKGILYTEVMERFLTEEELEAQEEE